MSTILVGSAPDSWGVWFPDDPNQTPYTRFLDEVAASGYEWIELGPFGYLPTDPKKLSDELASRNLKLSAGTVFEHLHQDNSWDAVWTQIEDVAQAHRRRRRQARRRHPRDVARPRHRRGARGPQSDCRAVEEEDRGHERARQGDVRKVRRACAVPPARRQPCRHRGERLPLPRRHRRRVRQPVPGHRPHQLLRRRQPRHHPACARAHRLSAPQAGRPGGAGQGRGRGPAVRRGGQARRDDRTAAGHPRHATAAGRRREARHRRLRDRRTGHVSL